MIPQGITLLQGDKRRTFGFTIKALSLCCEQHDPDGRGCGYTGLCHKLFDKRDDDWEWQKGFSAHKWWAFSPLARDGGDWLVHSTPGISSSQNRGGAM